MLFFEEVLAQLNSLHDKCICEENQLNIFVV